MVVGVDILSFPLAWGRVIKRGALKRDCSGIFFGILVFPVSAVFIIFTDFVLALHKLIDSSKIELLANNSGGSEILTEED